MSIFPKGAGVRYCLVLEIGSGSILASVVQSSATEPFPHVIWTHRELAGFKTDTQTIDSTKIILTALMQITMRVAEAGLEALRAVAPNASITDVQVSYCAPWSYTITKSIHYDQEKPSVVSTELLTQLINAAQKKINDERAEFDIAQDNGLKMVAQATTDIVVNGYRAMQPVGQTARTISITQISAVVQQKIAEAVLDMQQKIVTGIVPKQFTFMMLFHCIARKLFPQTTELCLVDITFEATEIAIIRNGSLQYCTYMPIGIHTLARNITKKLGIPTEDAYTVLKRPVDDVLSPQTKKAEAAVQEILAEYRGHVSQLFSETGDTLIIPKVIFVHSAMQSESFMSGHIKEAAFTASGVTHATYEITKELMRSMATGTTISTDTSSLIAAQFFHTQERCGNFIQM